MASLMTLTQYTARLGRTLTGAKATQAEAFLEDASDTVRRIAQGELDEATSNDLSGEIRMVIFSMVTRARTNPRGLSGERIADHSTQGDKPVYATDEEKQIILRAAGVGTVRVVDLTSDMPQRLTDNAAAVPIFTHLGGTD
ncbi:hypothetical protein [Nocardiopsis lucentensis]|uniref:hypothetical protein n=1 Tax=Nocardiopsis lucentensis TaxID=53441 RepID=UPI0003459B8D|nr:hypothetical protein [Nocardiopsis lucentensis]